MKKRTPPRAGGGAKIYARKQLYGVNRSARQSQQQGFRPSADDIPCLIFFLQTGLKRRATGLCPVREFLSMTGIPAAVIKLVLTIRTVGNGR